MKVICISGKAQHGKDSVGRYMRDILEEHGNSVLIAHYADLLKYICKQFFAWDGNKDEDGRTLLQYVGTDKVRAASPDYWANFIASLLHIFRDEWDYVIIPDCRFPNEYEIYEHFGIDATLVRVIRTNFESTLTYDQKNHISETALDAYDWDAIIVNDGSLDNLRKNVAEFVAEYL